MVDSDGILIASGAKFEGTITASAGYIGGFTIASSSLRSTNLFISGSPKVGGTNHPSYMFLSSSRFNIKENGDVTGSNVLFTGGKIAAFEISNHTLSNGSNFFISGSATGNEYFISASKFNVKASGDITGSKVLFDGGKIAGWEISEGYISKALSGSAAHQAYTRVYLSATTDDDKNIAEGLQVYRKDEDVEDGEVKIVRVGGLSATANLHANDDYGIQVIQKDSNTNYSNVMYIGKSTQTISGWSLGTDKLSGGSSGNYIALIPGTGIQLGHETFGSAPFSVTNAGVVKAESGVIGGWTLSDSLFKSSDGNIRLNASAKK